MYYKVRWDYKARRITKWYSTSVALFSCSYYYNHSWPSWFFVDIFFQCANFLTNYILELCIQLLFYTVLHLHEDGFSNFSLSFYFPLKSLEYFIKEYRRQKFYINIYLFLQKWRISFETLFYDMVHFANLLLFSQPECNLGSNNLPQ